MRALVLLLAPSAPAQDFALPAAGGAGRCLRVLDVSCTRLTDAALDAISATLACIECLDLRACGATEGCLARVVQRHGRRLRYLNAGENPPSQRCADLVPAIARHCTRALDALRLEAIFRAAAPGSASFVTDDGLRQLCTSAAFATLSFLDLTGCPSDGVDAPSLAHLALGPLPFLLRLDLANSRAVTAANLRALARAAHRDGHPPLLRTLNIGGTCRGCGAPELAAAMREVCAAFAELEALHMFTLPLVARSTSASQPTEFSRAARAVACSTTCALYALALPFVLPFFSCFCV